MDNILITRRAYQLQNYQSKTGEPRLKVEADCMDLDYGEVSLLIQDLRAVLVVMHPRTRSTK